jgi:hypothetical protein
MINHRLIVVGSCVADLSSMPLTIHTAFLWKTLSIPQQNKGNTTVLLNDLCDALLQGFPIDHVPASKNDLAAGYQLRKMCVNHKETLLAKTQDKLLKYQDILSFGQGTEDEKSIARNKDDLVAYIKKTVIDKLKLKELVVRIPFPVKHLADRVKTY